MPTENRSRNTEMVIVPREPCGEMLNAARNAPIPLVHLDSMSARQDLEFSARYKAAVARFPQPDPQPHPEPIAWMVGTAFWWTKEEAERDAAAMGLPIVGLGPMSAIAPAEQHQGEPVAPKLKKPRYTPTPCRFGGKDGYYQVGGVLVYDSLAEAQAAADRKNAELAQRYYGALEHADPGEVERLRVEIADLLEENRLMTNANAACGRELVELRAQLDALRELKLPEFLKLSDEMRAAGEHAEQRAREDQCYSVPVLKAVFFEAAVQQWLDDQEEALSASAEPSAPTSATHYYPAAEPDRQLRKKVGGLWCEFCGGKWLPLDEQGMSHEYVAIEPSAPVVRDERAEFEGWCRKEHVDPRSHKGADSWEGWRARAALERKP